MNYKPACGLCRYYAFSLSTGTKETEDYEETGICRRTPPVLVPGGHPGDYTDDESSYLWAQPMVHPEYDWCGLFELKPKSPEPPEEKS